MDERELRIGDRLDEALQQHIRASNIVLVLATSASASSKWVAMELDFARTSNPPIPVCPIFLESLQSHPLFRGDLGLDATDRHDFSLVIQRIAESLLGSPLPKPATDIIAEELNTLAAFDRRLGILVQACVSGIGPYFEHHMTIADASFFELDYVLNVLSHIAQGPARYYSACSTAELFAITGAGSCALRRYFETEEDRSGIALIAFAHELRPEDIHVAIHCLSEFDPPQDVVLFEFILRNAVRLKTDYERDVVRLITWPPRGPATLQDAAAQALCLWPENHDLMTLWGRWIRQGLFDGLPGAGASSPADLAFWVAEGLKDGSGERTQIFDFTVSHIRTLVRAATPEKVRSAYTYFLELANHGCRGLERVAAELDAAFWCAEWKDWEKEDREEREKWTARFRAVIDAARAGEDVANAAYHAEFG